MSSPVLTAPMTAPAYLSVPDRVGSYGDEAADLSAQIGRPLDPEQLLAVDAILSIRAGGQWAALESAVVIGRQNGKSGGILLPVVLFDLICGPPDKIVWTAHKFKTAMEAYNDAVNMFTNVDMLRKRVARISRTNDDRSITLTNGAVLAFLARSTGGGRGLGGARVILDEALFLDAAMMGSLMPTLSARPDPHLMYGSSAGVQRSEILRGIRDRGRAGGDPSLVYAEWCAPGGFSEPPCAAGRDCEHENDVAGCVFDDAEAIQAANPAYRRRIQPYYVAGERRALCATPEGRIEYARERMGWWDDPPEDGDLGLSLRAWSERLDPTSRPADDAPLAVAWDVSPGMASAAIALATYRDDGAVHVELVRYGRGTAWVPAALAGLVERQDLDDLACLPTEYTAAVAATFGDDLREVHAPLTRGEVPAAAVRFEASMDPTSTTISAAAAAAGLDGEDGQDAAALVLHHLGDALLDGAVRGLVKRAVGDGGWVPTRASSLSDITPICAVIAAVYRLLTADDLLDPEVFDL